MWPNENKMSDGGRERALLGAEGWKSFQKWSVCRSAVRSIVFHEKAFKLKMKFISVGGLRFGIGLPCGLGCGGPGLDPI